MLTMWAKLLKKYKKSKKLDAEKIASQYHIKFYQYFPDEQMVNACVHNLNWTHIRSLFRITDENARYWYMKEAVIESWNARILDCDISTGGTGEVKVLPRV